MIKMTNFAGNFWGGTAAMLVAMPAAIAFGVTIYVTIGGHFAAYGAIAGILGVAAIGIVASLLGGTQRLISAPSAPAAAVLSAFAMEHISHGMNADTVFVMLMVVALIAAIIQILFGVAGLGRLIKYMPFPVVSGYLSGVGLYIVAAQTPNFLGLSHGEHFLESIQSPALWQWESFVVGAVTIATMLYGERLFKAIPAVIMALAMGIGTYFLLALLKPSLFEPNNIFIIGTLGGNDGIDFFKMMSWRFHALLELSWENIGMLFFPALTLAALLSIDTLKTCVILDSMTHSFHNSNKELIAQGSGNLLSVLIGGMPGSGTMGATMVNISSGATTRLSGLIEGVMAVVAFVLLGTFIAWIPISALAGILIVIGFRMIDKHSLLLLNSKKTVLDFFIIVAVAVTALFVSLIAAAGVGLLLAIALYITQQIGASVVYRHLDGNDIRSKVIRSEEESVILTTKGGNFSVYELHGSLFFGTANQLYSMLRDDLKEKKYIIMDMKRVQTVDLTAAHILLQIKDILHDNNGYLLLSRLPHKLPTGDDMESYFNQVGLLKHLSPIKVFDDLEYAIEWVEERVLSENRSAITEELLYELKDFSLLGHRKQETIDEIQGSFECRSFKKGEIIFKQGDLAGELYLIRRGLVRIVLRVSEHSIVHLSTLGQGNFFGEFSFLEGSPQYSEAFATMDTDLFVISREAFDEFSQRHHRASFRFMQSLATVLAERLRLTSSELGAEYDV
ncbi:MAG: SulP family inorganic anion transporter [Sulfurimonas sp.]|nr:SulP family inorganic anion transporter [Sulfurimonas sp.]